MDSPRWFDRSLPQTLQIATLLLYMNGIVTLLFSSFAPLVFLPAAAELVGAYGISNSKRWGYITAVVGAVFPLLILAIYAVSLQISIFKLIFASPLTLVFEIALVALLLHPQSRQHQNIWFR